MIRSGSGSRQSCLGCQTIQAAEDVQEAIDAAQEGKRPWRATPVHERTRILLKAADEIDARREELARSLSEEMGKIIREARGEIRVCAQILRALPRRPAASTVTR